MKSMPLLKGIGRNKHLEIQIQIVFSMATYTISINERTQIGRSILQLMQELTSVFKVQKTQKAKTAFERSQDDIAAGRVSKAKSTKDLMAAIYAD